MDNDQDNSQFLDAFISPQVREFLEKTYYDKISEQAKIDNALKDPSFLVDMESHIALYGDHGKTHARDVAKLVLNTLDKTNGTLIRYREPYRLNFMKSFGVHIAFLHDIGMINFSDIGRKMHPEFASQVVFSEDFDKYIDIIWSENSGNMSWRIMNLCKNINVLYSKKALLRECLSLVFTHSKSAHSVEQLNYPKLLRKQIVDMLTNNLEYLYYENKIESLEISLKNSNEDVDRKKLELNLKEAKNRFEELQDYKDCSTTKNNIENLYNNFNKDSFSWFFEESEEALDFYDDIIDTLRTLRAADALRQRGECSKTAAGYQMYVNTYNGNLTIIMVDKDQRVFILESARPINLGEANIQVSDLTKSGDIYFAFITGLFRSDAAMEAAAKATAPVINSIFLDVSEAFTFPSNYRGIEKLIKHTPISLMIENTSTNLNFTKKIGEELLKINPSLNEAIQYVSPLSQVPAEEKTRYLSALPYTASLEERNETIHEIGLRGYKTKQMDPETLFNGTRIYTLTEKELLLSSGSPSGFVYLPFSGGLVGYPNGGFEAFQIPSYSIVGEASLLSGGRRNATVISEHAVKILIIPMDTYMTHWYAAYTPTELFEVFKLLYHKENDGTSN